ncbi:MAG: hypothetical protein Q8P63_03030 [Candidatus Nealsonbacteria bacterium]|nr:hypothetical protein [Candidatus Nealsonbacteria bacterium]
MVGIIPKPPKKTAKWQIIILYAVLGLLVVVVLGYGSLFYFENKGSKEMADLEERASKFGTPEEKNLEEQVLSDKVKLNDFAGLLESHNKNSKFFAFLEENSHPKVWFTDLKLDSSKAEAVLAGEAPNFKIFGQQMLIFENNELVESTAISKLTINDEGKAEFAVSLMLNPGIFK